MKCEGTRRWVSRNQRRSWRTLSGLLCGLLLACGGTEASTDTRTNWLSSCTADVACGDGLSCVCGVCTTPCTADETCAPLGAAAECVAVQGCSLAAQVCARADFDVTVFSEADAATSAPSESEPSASAPLSATASTQPSVAQSSSAQSSSAPSVTSADPMLDASAPRDANMALDAEVDSEVTDASVPDACDIPGRSYESRDPAECVTVPDCGVVAEGIGNVPFSDECGCGCEPYVAPVRTDSIQERGCIGGPTGSAYPIAMVAGGVLSGPTSCLEVPNAVIRNEAELSAWVDASGCADIAEAVAIVDYSIQTLVILGFSGRPEADLFYTAQTIDGVMHFGILAPPYCDGAQPTAGYVAIALDATQSAVRIDVETCFDYCPADGGLPPP